MANGYRILVIGLTTILGVIFLIESSSTGSAQDSPLAGPSSEATTNIEGVVSSVVDVRGYTYVQIKSDVGEVWAAAPSVAIEIGDTVAFSTRMPMRNFYSNSLQRKFDLIYFVDRFLLADQISSFSSDAAAAHGGNVDQAAVASVTGIDKAEGGYSIQEILGRGDGLVGETVRVRGRVVKFTASVMNTNWIRIRDGSTEGELVIPTAESVALNDIILVEGRFVRDLNLGQGYVIPAVLEDATITVE